ncbi:MAG: hypothetical protein WDN28_19695 [Chthoniobacter sp.]
MDVESTSDEIHKFRGFYRFSRIECSHAGAVLPLDLERRDTVHLFRIQVHTKADGSQKAETLGDGATFFRRQDEGERKEAGSTVALSAVDIGFSGPNLGNGGVQVRNRRSRSIQDGKGDVSRFLSRDGWFGKFCGQVDVVREFLDPRLPAKVFVFGGQKATPDVKMVADAMPGGRGIQQAIRMPNENTQRMERTEEQPTPWCQRPVSALAENVMKTERVSDTEQKEIDAEPDQQSTRDRAGEERQRHQSEREQSDDNGKSHGDFVTRLSTLPRHSPIRTTHGSLRRASDAHQSSKPSPWGLRLI